MQQIYLNNGCVRAEVCPSLGGGLSRFDAWVESHWVPIFRASPAAVRDPDELALYPLLPWSNRISSGFWWRDSYVALRPNRAHEPFPLHGDAWLSAWSVTGHSPSMASLALRGSNAAPYDYEACLAYHLVGSALLVSLKVTHLGEKPLPYGMGLHPWIHRLPGTKVEAMAAGQWVGNPTSYLPTHRIDRVADAPLLPTGYIDSGFEGWNGEALVTWPDRSISMSIRTEPALAHFVVYSPGTHADFFCFEPVSHRIDAHTSSYPEAGGLRELRTHDSMQASFTFQINTAR